ncbi:MAG: hypothetical protein JO353_02200, partial [Phycisphaerae bacterium]|nr:hypothetical protein [Phycisphaerae bacterium]
MRWLMRHLMLAACLGLLGAATPDGASDFLTGLESLNAGKPGDAIAPLNKAVDADEENPDYRLARAVATILSDHPADAISDLERAEKLRPNYRDAKLWHASAVAMQGDFTHDSDIYPFAQFQDTYGNAVRAMSHHYGQYYFELDEAQRLKQQGMGNGDADPAAKRDIANARAQFPALARQFVEQEETELSARDPSWATLLKNRAVENSNRSPAGNKQVGDLRAGEALGELARQLSAHPGDPALLSAHAAAELKCGAPEMAQLEATWALSRDVNLADAYRTRAVAAAASGDAHRASADWELLAKLRPGTSTADRAAVDAATATAPPPITADAIPGELNKLHQMAKDNAGWEALVTQALAIVKGENNVRRRSDENYQLRLRELTLGTQANPKSAEAHALLGEFIYDNAVNVPGEAVEPRAAFRNYRYLLAGQQDQEIALAAQELDRAMAIDPKNIRAIAAKADLLIYQLQWGDAETLIRA